MTTFPKDRSQKSEESNKATSMATRLGNKEATPEKVQADITPLDTATWEAQVGWQYIGHGEWIQLEKEQNGGVENRVEHEPRWIKAWMADNDPDIQKHQEVLSKGYPNRWGARIRVESTWNIELFSSLLADYEDREVVEWLKYGWPTGRLPTLQPPTLNKKNHKGATDYPEQMKKYISKEAKYKAIMGPYKKIPFKQNIGISRLSSRPKKDSLDRRIILDLSFPPGNSVNDGIPKDTYLGFQAKLTFLKTDELALRIYQLRKGCYMFKIDPSRYFRQIPLDPGDYSLIGYIIDGEIYFDKVLPMGMRSAPFIAQRITNAISYIHQTLKYFILNYVDDFVGAEEKVNIWKAYRALENLLQSLRVETSKDKIVPPATRLEFLGITF